MAPQKRRKSSRRRVKTGVVALFKQGGTQLAKIIDVSETGLTFIYDENEIELGSSVDLDVLFMKEDIFWPHVQCAIVSNIMCRVPRQQGAVRQRRCCVRFNNLTPRQLSQLRRVIHQQ